MLEFAAGLFDPTGFTPRANSGEGWTPALVWLHAGGDLFIWLAFLSIPLILLYFTRRRGLPYPRLFVLFALFILACGVGHLIEALMFQYPLYRLAGAWKVGTAVVAWATVFALIPVAPKAMAAMTAAGNSHAADGLRDTTLHRLAAPTARGRLNDYIVAVLAGVLALLVRAAVDEVAETDHLYVIPLLAVVFVSWQSGFGPGVLTLLVGLLGMAYFFVEPRRSFVVERFGNQFAMAMFFFCGACCAGLGEAQRVSRRATKAALAAALEQKDELAAEVSRRRETEARKTAILESAMDCIVTIDAAGRVVEFNPAAERTFGYARDEAVGRDMAELVIPPPMRGAHREGVARYLATGEGPILNRRLELTAVRRGGAEFPVEVSITPIPVPGGPPLFTGYLRDIADRKRAEAELAERARVAALRADTAEALAAGGGMRGALQLCAETLVRHTGAAFARVWTTDPAGDWLELQASAGQYTHTDGPHSRIRVGEYKIGRIAASARSHLTNDVRHDPNISDPEWAEREGMVAFAGYPLVVEGKILGVMALFSREPLSDGLTAELVPVAESVAQYIDRRRAEVALRGSEERYRTLTEAIPQIVWNAGPDGEISYFNQRWLDYTGVPLNEARGQGWMSAVHPGDRDDTFAAWRQVVETAAAGTGDRFSRAIRLRRAGTDEYRWFLTAANPLRRPDGSVDQWIGAMADVHDQQTAAERIAESERRFRTLTEAVPQMVWTADPRGEVTFVNRRWDEYTGEPAGTGRGSGWGDVIHPDDAEQHRAEWQLAVARQPDQFTDEFRLRRAADGQYRWMLSTAVPLRDPVGAVAEWVGSITDIDDQKRYAEILERTVRERTAELAAEVEERRLAEAQVRSVAAELARSNGELEQFAYIASHDLQEPLRKIQAFGDRLTTKHRDALPETGREYVDRMQVSAGRMRRLIDDLLTFSRVTTQARSFARIDLGKLVREVVSDLSERIDPSGGEVQVGDLPGIDADLTQMRQLFQNLIANAVKFHRPGVPPVVEVTAEPVTEPVPACRLTVRDNGIGFDTKYLDRIFQVFQRLHGKDEYEGTGVGLAICRKIVERHGGTITARSRIGEGTAFVVTLPVRQPDPPDEPP